jgi:hypothetical protein
MDIDEAEIRRRFLYHAPTDETRGIHDAIRAEEIRHASAMAELVPGASREKSLLFTALEESSFWAHAHVARNMQ